MPQICPRGYGLKMILVDAVPQQVSEILGWNVLSKPAGQRQIVPEKSQCAISVRRQWVSLNGPEVSYDRMPKRTFI